jgi:hypothetical protein
MKLEYDFFSSPSKAGDSSWKILSSQECPTPSESSRNSQFSGTSSTISTRKQVDEIKTTLLAALEFRKQGREDEFLSTLRE